MQALLASITPKNRSVYFPIDEIPQEDTSAIHRAQARAMPDSQEAEMSLPGPGRGGSRWYPPGESHQWGSTTHRCSS
jgi:hypothetical protein